MNALCSSHACKKGNKNEPVGSQKGSLCPQNKPGGECKLLPTLDTLWRNTMYEPAMVLVEVQCILREDVMQVVYETCTTRCNICVPQRCTEQG